MSKDLLDAFERRLDSRQLENGELPKLTADEKRIFLKSLTEKIGELQQAKEKLETRNQAYRFNPEYKNICLSQMMLMWTYDQVKFGKM